MQKLAALIFVLGACAADDAEPGLPTCEELGCDGTQAVPLYCPNDDLATNGNHAGECFCAAPEGPDGWCIPGGAS